MNKTFLFDRPQLDPSILAPGEAVVYKGKTAVSVFGRELKDGVAQYYWVYDGKKRFKAFPDELKRYDK